ncbi:MAG: FAD:protein FMN transferase [Woeseiaceae bacterium]
MRVVLLIALMTLAACGGSSAGQVELVGSTMGTQFSIKLPGGLNDHDAAELQEAIQAALDDDEAEMSTYQPDSHISRFNSSQVTDWQSVERSFCEKVQQSLAISEQTDGAFDITVGPLVNLWGFGPGKLIDEPPSEDAIAALMTETGYENLHADCSRPAVKKDIPGLYLDMSGIGKGYAADRIGKLLASLGFDSFMVEVGGELNIRGLNSKGEPWAIGIEAPLPDTRKPHTIIHLTNTAMATSGDYRNFFEADGKLYSHTIDTRTGRPVEHTLASVTVVDYDGWRADAMATALLVMGPKEGLAFAERENMAVLMLLRTNGGIDELQTAAFARLRDNS